MGGNWGLEKQLPWVRDLVRLTGRVVLKERESNRDGEFV